MNSATTHQDFRAARWFVLIWIPLLSWASLGVIKGIGGIAAESGGGASAAPLAAVAAAMVLGVVLILGVIIAIVMTIAIPSATRTALRSATSQEIVLRILDSSGKPLPGASVQYTRYGYGPRGTHVYDGKGGPIISDENGFALIPSRAMRYETEAAVTKSGYREVFFTLGMQYSKWDETREVVLATDQTKYLARINIPAVDPVSFSIYLPPQSDTPAHPLKQIEAHSDIGQNPNAARFLNLDTGKFSQGPEGDIRFDLFFEKENGQYERPRLWVTGVNGAKVTQVPPSFSLLEGVPAYESLFRIAPKTGFQDSTVIQRPGDQPGPMIYVMAGNGGDMRGSPLMRGEKARSRKHPVGLSYS